MYRTPTPPLFDIPDFPTFRRVKPLPKRPRTSCNFKSDTNLNIHPSNSGINPTLVSHSNSHLTYATSTYSTHTPQLPSQHIPRSPDVLSSVEGGHRSQYDWRLPPEFFLPEEVLRVACAFPETGTAPRIDDGGGGNDGGDETDEPFLPLTRKSPQLLSSGTSPVVATPPPPSDTSTDDEQLQELTQTPYRPTSFRSTKQQLNHKGIDVEEDLVSESKEHPSDRLLLRAETDRLLAHADSLSAKIALRSYYHSMGYNVAEFGSSVSASPVPSGPGMGPFRSDFAVSPATGAAPLNSGVTVANTTRLSNVLPGNGYISIGVGKGHDEGDYGSRGGDCAEHSNQLEQGNTKKRKVPANIGNSPPHHHHHHFNHYSSHRPINGSNALAYGPTEDVEGDEKSFNLGLGLNFDLGIETSMENPGSGPMLEGVESDIFGPLHGTYQHEPNLTSLQPTQRYSPRQFHRKAKLSPVTLAGMQRKELIRTRKKQLEVIMGTLGDSWALDHALSANFPPLLSSTSSNSSTSNSPSTDSDQGTSRTGPMFRRPDGESDENWDISWGWNDRESKEMKVKLSKRKKLRVARSAGIGLGRLGRHPDAAPFPTGDFVFSYPSSTAERLVTIQEEVANLRNLFGTELARQSAKSVKIAVGTSKGSGPGLGKTRKKRVQQRARTTMSAESGERQAEFMEMPQKIADSSVQPQTSSSQVSQNQNQSQTPTPKKGKKKKRSTMANASNPHHLRNYVPSRLPHAAGGGGSSGGNNGQGNQPTSVNMLWPLALKFLSADLPPRKRKGISRHDIKVQSVPQLVIPQEEWICSFCEYNLFYGEEAEYRRGVRNRKKILRRRRRARERAAAAASGVSAALKNVTGVTPVAEKGRVEDEDEEYEDPLHESVPPTSAKIRMDGTGRPRAPEAPG